MLRFLLLLRCFIYLSAPEPFTERGDLPIAYQGMTTRFWYEMESECAGSIIFVCYFAVKDALMRDKSSALISGLAHSETSADPPFG